MTQAHLDLDLDLPAELAAPHAVDAAADPTPPAVAGDRTAFSIGWDHARFGLVPPGVWREAGAGVAAVGAGWRAGQAVFGRRTPAANRWVRRWLALRLAAWRRGLPLDAQQVTPTLLAKIDVERCPVTRRPLGGAPDDDDAAVVAPLGPGGAYRAGAIALLAACAAQALHGADARGLALQALRCGSGAVEAPAGLDAGALGRLATLAAFATPLPFADAAALPLAVLPPPGVEPVNAVQRLQLALTRDFAQPGWAARLRQRAERLPDAALRHDFLLFVGAFAPRLPDAAADAVTTRHALEDAWCDARVQRRWRQFVLALGEQRLAAWAGAAELRPAARRAATAAAAAAAAAR